MMVSYNVDLYNIVHSMRREIYYFEATYNKSPSAIFMSHTLFKYMGSPHIFISQDNKYYFEGIEVKPYPCSEFEYYLSEKRGEFWEFE